MSVKREIFPTHNEYEDKALNRIMENIAELGLQDQLIELETQGFTVLKGALSSEQIEHAKALILQRVEGIAGKAVDVENATETELSGTNYVPYLLYDDEVFQDILLNPKPLALITYLLGESCVLSAMPAFCKGPGESSVLPLHADMGGGIPAPFPSYAMVANCSYALTPTSREAGALALVPGSHKFARHPTGQESSLAGHTCNPSAVSVDLNPGDAVLWHGHAWHGSFPRKIPGVRIQMATYFSRPFLATQELHKGVVPPEVMARHADNPRFRTLVGENQPYGWQYEGLDNDKVAAVPKGLYD